MYTHACNIASRFLNLRTLHRVGKYFIQLCGTTPCMVNGSEEIKATIEAHLGIKEGETSADGMWTLKEVCVVRVWNYDAACSASAAPACFYSVCIVCARHSFSNLFVRVLGFRYHAYINELSRGPLCLHHFHDVFFASPHCVQVECLGACANAPMIQINDDFYECLTPATTKQVLDSFTAGEWLISRTMPTSTWCALKTRTQLQLELLLCPRF